MRLVGDARFSDAIRTHATQTRNLASALGERMSGDTADAFHQRLVQAASQGGGRLLVVDTDGKVTDDTFGERCGTLLALSEVHTILRGEKDADYGFHLQDGAGKTQAPSVLDALTGRDVSRIWVGCFAAPLEEDGQRLGVLVLLTDVQETVDSLISVRDRMVFIFLLALAVVLVLAGLISRIVTKPVAELSGGIERMSKGDYEYRVHVPGKGEMAQLAAAFNQMSEQVHNLDEARNQFVSNASHELKTPLATIKILVESMMYQDDMDPALRKEFLGDIDKEIDRLSSVVGDLLTLACGFLFAAHIIAVEQCQKKTNPYALIVLQFAFCGLYAAVYSLTFERGMPMTFSPGSVGGLLYIAVFSTTIGMSLQNIGQSMAPASHAVILLSLESVFGVLFSCLLLGEKVTLQMGVGFAIIFAALLVSELAPGKKD